MNENRLWDVDNVERCLTHHTLLISPVSLFVVWPFMYIYISHCLLIYYTLRLFSLLLSAR